MVRQGTQWWSFAAGGLSAVLHANAATLQLWSGSQGHLQMTQGVASWSWHGIAYGEVGSRPNMKLNTFSAIFNGKSIKLIVVLGVVRTFGHGQIGHTG